VTARPPRAREVLALLDDAAVAASVLELSAALAGVVQRDLAVVYVESESALSAAALPVTSVLAHAGAQWAPFAPQDVERGYRAQAARLRQLIAHLPARYAVRCSMRVTRGALQQTALDLLTEADLILVGSMSSAAALSARQAPRTRGRLVVTALSDGTASGDAAVSLARRVAAALEAVVHVTRVELGAAGGAAALAESMRSDLLVVPHALLDAQAMAKLACTTLLVGEGASTADSVERPHESAR